MIISSNSFKIKHKLPRLARSDNSSNKISKRTSGSTDKYISLPGLRSPMSFKPALSSQLSQKYESYIKEKLEVTARLEALSHKIIFIKETQEKYGVKFKNSEIKTLSCNLLNKKAKKLYAQKVRKFAYDRITKWWKRNLIRKQLKKDKELVEKACILIQCAWRSFLSRKKFQVLIENLLILQAKAAITIQKVFRGYLTRKKFSVCLKKQKLLQTFEFFENMKKLLHTSSAHTIGQAWLAHKLKKKAKATRLLLKARKRTNITIVLPENQSSTKAKPSLVMNNSIESPKKAQSEPESPKVRLSRFRSGTVDFIGLKAKRIN